MPSTQWLFARSELQAASAQVKPHGMRLITVMIPLRLQLDALINDLVWVIKRRTKKKNKRKTWRCACPFFFFFPLLLLDIKISRWFLWFVAFARGHVVMKVLALSMHLVKELCLMPHWFDIFHFFFCFMVPTWLQTGGLLSRHQAMC